MSSQHPSVLILTPVKSAVPHLDTYFAGIERLTYPRHCLSLGILEGDSLEDTYSALARRLPDACSGFARKQLLRKDFGFQIPIDTPRFAVVYQAPRRAVLARARNHLLFGALQDEEWVLWLDVDVVDYPPDIVQRLLSYEKDIIQPNCVREYGGESFDLNAWCDGGRKHIRDPHPLRGRAVGEIETEGLAIMAKDMGVECWGLPDLEIRHSAD
jgi:hypothetical protein